ncbi:L-serine ammonia-lyase [Blattamonas nauphoetae]|uniref:L-serine ammonia-lyase n=1 Tax=Blattamonas nauphoetae TaxID=2049346 RepID=A0ABQ9YHP4_9EUKA|nr:L-serine ammonia-lyase [Blattamonas nauphoetae]
MSTDNSLLPSLYPANLTSRQRAALTLVKQRIRTLENIARDRQQDVPDSNLQLLLFDASSQQVVLYHSLSDSYILLPETPEDVCPTCGRPWNRNTRKPPSSRPTFQSEQYFSMLARLLSQNIAFQRNGLSRSAQLVAEPQEDELEEVNPPLVPISLQLNQPSPSPVPSSSISTPPTAVRDLGTSPHPYFNLSMSPLLPARVSLSLDQDHDQTPPLPRSSHHGFHPPANLVSPEITLGYFHTFFHPLGLIGQGSFGKVIKCSHVLRGYDMGVYVTKVISLGHIASQAPSPTPSPPALLPQPRRRHRKEKKESDAWLLLTLREVRILSHLHHPNIVEYRHSWIESASTADAHSDLYILMEYANGGNLHDFLLNSHVLLDTQIRLELKSEIMREEDRLRHIGTDSQSSDSDPTTPHKHHTPRQRNHWLYFPRRHARRERYRRLHRLPVKKEMRLDENDKPTRSIFEDFRVCSGGVRKMGEDQPIIKGAASEAILKKMQREREKLRTEKQSRIEHRRMKLRHLQQQKASRQAVPQPSLSTFMQVDEEAEKDSSSEDEESPMDSDTSSLSVYEDTALAGSFLESEPNRRILTDREVFDLFSQISFGLHYLHTMGVIHCDLKGQNILLNHTVTANNKPQHFAHPSRTHFGPQPASKKSTKSDKKSIFFPSYALAGTTQDPPNTIRTRTLISDFGQSILTIEDKQTAQSGTTAYTSPELLRDGTSVCSEESDVWALGVILYLISFSALPFDGDSEEKVVEQILSLKRLPHPPPPFDWVVFDDPSTLTATSLHPRPLLPSPPRQYPRSPHIIQLVSALLNPSPEARPSMNTVLQGIRHLSQLRNVTALFLFTHPLRFLLFLPSLHPLCHRLARQYLHINCHQLFRRNSLYTTMMHKLIEYRIKIPQKEVLEKKLTIIAQKHRNFEEALHYYQTRHEQSLGGESAEALLCPPEALSIEANFQAILTGNNLEDIPSTDADLASKGHKQEEKATADDFVTENEENLDIDTEIDDDGFDFVDDDGFGFDDQEETKRTLEESEEMGEKRVRITNDGSDDGIVLPPPVFRKASLLQAGDATANELKQHIITRTPSFAQIAFQRRPSMANLSEDQAGFVHSEKDLAQAVPALKTLDLQMEYEKRMAAKMESLRHLFRIGQGPSSSHTMGPRRAAGRFLKNFPDCKTVRVTLFGSLASTGKGHLTDVAILEGLKGKEVEIVWEPDKELGKHNGLRFEAMDGSKAGQKYECYSIGGGAILDESTQGGAPGTAANAVHEIYPYSNFTMILHWVEETHKPLWQYVDEYEDPKIWQYLKKVWHQMKTAVKTGLDSTQSVLPGSLNTPRRAQSLYLKSRRLHESNRRSTLLMAFAMAVSEENAGGGIVVTAPTCGACGVVPACLYYMQMKEGLTDEEVIRALAVAGLIGNLIKANGSISGAECGCQAEIGSASAMAAGALTMLMGGSPFQIGQAAATALEHCLGLTCDPCDGLVQIPCIERNGFYANHAFCAAELAIIEDGRNPISLDEVIFTMYLTGKAMREEFRETSKGGLATTFGLDEHQNIHLLRKDVQDDMKREVEERNARQARGENEWWQNQHEGDSDSEESFQSPSSHPQKRGQFSSGYTPLSVPDFTSFQLQMSQRKRND